MSRSGYIRTVLSKGIPLLGVFPAVSPREVIRAAGMHPVEIWDPPRLVDLSARHVPAFTCSIASTALSFIYSEPAELCTGFLFPHTCDSLQNVSSIVSDFVKNDQSCLHFYNPKHSDQKIARKFYQAQLEKLGDRLSAITGADWRQELPTVIAREFAVEKLMLELLDFRAQGRIKSSNVEFFEILRCIEYMTLSDYSALLEEFIEKRKSDAPSEGLGILLSGVLPAPEGLPALLDRLGLSVVADDLLGVSRRIGPQSIDSNIPPLEYLSRKYFNLPPCPTRGGALTGRISHILKTIDHTGADGVVFVEMQMCEPEQFDLPLIEEALKLKDIPSLRIEVGLNSKLSGQHVTRIEAFKELVSG